MSVPVAAPSPALFAILAGVLAGFLFLLPRMAASAPFLALPLSIAGLLSAVPLLSVRLNGRLSHALLALLAAGLVILGVSGPDGALAFTILFGLWALVAGEVLARRRSVIEGCAAGFGILAIEALLTVVADGTASFDQTLRSPQVQAAFDQWAHQVPLDAEEARTTIESVRSGILALYPSLSVISAATIVALNALVLARLVGRRGDSFPKDELLLFRWPLALVVAFVASGALLLLPDLQTVAWNGLVMTLFLFLLQGLAVLSFTVVQIFTSPLMRFLVIVASLLGPWALLLSLLGLFDQWFDFRKRFAGGPAEKAPPDADLQ